ncbi:energy transducer TonB [Thermodesulfobium sp. 4217-1]|uniref:energy transducer TonB n=1 Tax=Thermodesulfobium sp. 4217-1 TaxID=3120013 RepID=UPI0032215EBC
MNRRFSLSFIFSIIFHSLLFGTVFLLGATNIIKNEPIFIMSLNSLQESQKDTAKKVNKSDKAKTSEKNITEESLEKIPAIVQTVNATNLSYIQTRPVNTSNPVSSNGSLSNNNLGSANQRISSDSIYSKSFGSSDGPKFIKRIIPEYPLREKRLGIEGKVVLELLIDEGGHLISVKVLESTNDDFAQAALRAVRESTFRAATENGAFVRSRAILPIRFLLED